MDDKQTSANYNTIIEKVSVLVRENNQSRNKVLQDICDLLANNITAFDWVGFYLTDPEVERELVLGPFNGEPTEHTRIPFGKGICGQSADTHQTFVIQDVAKADNYISCSVDVRAEIVVPIIKDDAYVAQIDIDSNTKNSITKEHREMLEKICDILVDLF